MNGYINHLIQRHIEPAASVRPRLPGIFERPAYGAVFPVTENIAPAVQSKEGKTVAIPPAVNFTAPLPANEGRFLQEGYLKKEAAIDPVNDSRVEQHGVADHTENILPLIPSFSQQALNSKMNSGDGPQSVNLWDQPTSDPESLLIQPLSMQPQIEILKHKPGEKAEAVKPATKESSPAIPSYQSTITPRLKIVEIERPQERAAVIKVSIGRIEVKAITTASPIKTTRTGITAPKLSLDDYLKQRNNAG